MPFYAPSDFFIYFIFKNSLFQEITLSHLNHILINNITKARNDGFHDICARLSFAQFENPSEDYPPTTRGIKDFKSVIWMGDLNYRIFDHINGAKVKEMIAEGKLDELFENDQLQMQQRQKNAFEDFTEGFIKFNPTYRYDRGRHKIV